MDKKEMKITEITICLAAHERSNAERQMELLKPVEDKVNVHWNNRVDRHPNPHPSFAEMMNHAITTSPTEFVININDRITPKPEDILHIINLLENGFAVATKYSSAFWGTSKELHRTIGWWDERFWGGGYEDDDMVLRLKLANLCYYESQEASYLEARRTNQQEKIDWEKDRDPRGMNCAISLPHFNKKWKQESRTITKVLEEETYKDYDEAAGPSRPDIKTSWRCWYDSVLGVDYKFPVAGETRTKWFYLHDQKGSPIQVNGSWAQYREVLSKV